MLLADDLHQLLEIVPDFHDAFTRLASVYKKEGKIHELIEVYENAEITDLYGNYNSYEEDGDD